MAIRRKEETESNGKGKIKFRYTDSERTVDFTVENIAGTSVTEGIRSLANVLAGRTIVGEGRRPPKAKSELGAAPVIDHEEQVEAL